MKSYIVASSIIFGLVAAMHLVRLLGQWDVTIAGWSAPNWVSVVALLVAGFLSLAGFRVFQQVQRASLSR